MKLSSRKRNAVLGVLFFLPVAFILVMMFAKDNYNPLDVVNDNVVEFPINEDSLQLNGHLTVLSFWGKKPMEHSTAAFNLKELVYDINKGFKTFQVVVMLPPSAKAEAETLLKEIKSYEDLRFWHLLYTDEAQIRRVFNNLRSEVELDDNLGSDAVYIIDREMNQRGRLDDRTKKEIETGTPVYGLFDYDCIDVGELKNKMAAEDMRVLFKEYRDKRKGNFAESDKRRQEGIKQ